MAEPLESNALPVDIAANPLLSRWFAIDADGTIEIRAGKVELGQGVAVMQWQIAAEELDVAPSSIRLRLGDTDLGPDQGLTSGSSSTEVGGMALRRVCAEVRRLFVQAASRRLGVPEASIVVDNGVFSVAGEDVASDPATHAMSGAAEAGGHGSAIAAATAASEVLDYAALSPDVDLDQAASGLARPKPRLARHLPESGLPRPDLERKLFGAGFIHDIDWPGMLHGRMVRPPSYGSSRPVLDDAARASIMAMPGMHTLFLQGRHLGVAAEREEQAIAAADALRRALVWSPSEPLQQGNDDQSWLRELPSTASVVHLAPGDAGASAEADTAAKRFVADYSRPFVAHASIGPSCALARWDGGRLSICSHTQGTFTLRRELSMLLGIDLAAVRVTHADGAGCYGHNGADDAAIDAALLSKAAGRPVRVQWTREDEMSLAPFGSAMSMRVEAELSGDGRIASWNHDTWSFSHVQRPGLLTHPRSLAAMLREPPVPPGEARDFPLPAGGGQRNSVPLYALPRMNIGYHLLEEPVLRTSALRALGAYANVFALESAMDEMALLAGSDPLEFRLRHLNDPRARAVLQAAADAARWQEPKSDWAGEDTVRGRGMALARYKNSAAYCAIVVEIDVSDRIVLDRVWVAVDAGEVVHRDGLVNQIEGGVLQAASWTLKEAVRWDVQGVATRSWDDYPILNFDEIPTSVEVVCLSMPDSPPLGVGECVAGPTAAAIANALADAIGLRMRHLPLTPDRLMQAMQESGDA